MRILHVISGIEPENGGPTAALAGHCRALVKAGVPTGIVATWKYESSFAQADALRADGVGVTLLGPTKRPFRTHPDIARVLSEAIAEHDVVHIHAVWEWIEHKTAALARVANKPVVWTPHGMLDEWNMRRNHYFKRACLAAYLRRDLKAAAAIHVATDFEAKQVSRLKLGTPFFVQGFGLSEDLLHADVPRGRFRDRHGLPADEPVVLFLGRIQHGKGLEILVPAIAAMKKRATLVVAGPNEGNYRERIDSLIATHGVAGRVKFVGLIGGDEKREALTDTDVLAAPSAHENFGIAVAEAIALGTAVAVSDQVGLAGLIAANDLGRVTPLTIPATTAALDELVDIDPARRERSRRVAREHFDWPTIAAAWTAEYARLIPSPGRPGES